MTPSERGALRFVRFTAACIFGLGLLEVLLNIADARAHHRPVEIIPCVAWAVVSVVSLVVLIRSRAIAEWISDWLDS